MFCLGGKVSAGEKSFAVPRPHRGIDSEGFDVLDGRVPCGEIYLFASKYGFGINHQSCPLQIFLVELCCPLVTYCLIEI